MKAHSRLWLMVFAMALVALALIPLASGPNHAAGPWYVALGGSDSDLCTSPETACATINGAIGKATSGDTIYVAYGTYTGTGDQVVLLTKSVAVSGGWDGAFLTQSGTSTIDGQGARRGIVVQDSVSVTVDRFTIQNGFDPSWIAGGILNYGTTTLSRSNLMGCRDSAMDSGAIHNYGAMTLSESTISGGSGGGIINDGTITLTLSTVRDNAAAGILNWHAGDVTLIQSLVAGNGFRGIRNVSGKVALSNSTVSRNTMLAYLDRGGGIYNWEGTVILDNSTVSGNTSAFTAGGIWVGGHGQLVLSSSTVSGNAADNDSGGIRVDEGTVTLRNSVVAGNVAGVGGPDCSTGPGTLQSAGYNLIGNAVDCAFVPGTGDLVSVDARLGPLEGSPGHQPLLPGSPAIDAGNPAGCTDHLGHPLPADQRGLPRVGRCDMGAYEAQPIDYAAKTASSPTAYAGAHLTYTIALSNPTALDVTDAHVSDSLPPSLTYVEGSLGATSGSCGYSTGAITWTGTLSAGGAVKVSFGATVSDVLGYIVNSVVIRGGGAVVTRSVAVQGGGGICNLAKHVANPVLPVGPSGSWDSDYVWMPVVVKEGGLHKMWYTGGDGVNPSRIGLATSTDGVTWAKHPANPVLSPARVWEAGGIWAGSVISEDGVYRMWYAGRNAIWGQTTEIGHATSSDGIVWTRNPDDGTVLGVGKPGSWEDAHVSGPSVLKDGDVYHLWYTGDDGITARLGHATSNDGILWIRDPANPVLDTGAPGAWDWLGVYGPRVLAYVNGYLLSYSGQTLPTAWQTGYAMSFDGRDWTRKGLLIPEGPAGHFDAESADHASVLVDEAGFRAWYSGLNAGGTYQIGYAAEACGAEPSNPIYLPVVMRGFDSQCPAAYADSFGDPGSGWPISDNSYRRYAYVSGEYQIWVKQPSQGWLVTPGAKATDYAVAVNARRTSGSDGAYGIAFGINEDWSEYYEVIIDPNYYSIWRYSHGSWTVLRDWTSSTYIKTGTEWNRLKMIRSGSSIAVYANGHHLATVVDGSFSGLRRIGLVVNSPDTGALDARFDDFVLYPASCGSSAAAAGLEMEAAEARKVPVPPLNSLR